MKPLLSSTTLYVLIGLVSVVLVDSWTFKPSSFTCSCWRQRTPSTLLLFAASKRHKDSSSFPFESNNKDPLDGISRLLDDGNGHIRADLATSIWNWDNNHRKRDHLAKFQYSTRAGLRLVDEIAKELLSTTTTSNNRAVMAYSDLVQEGVLALMFCMAKYNPELQTESFEHYARRHIHSSLTKVLAHESRPMTLPAHVMTLLQTAKRKRQALLTKTKREPTLAQVAQELNVTPQELELYTLLGSTYSVERTMEIYDPLLENKATFADQDTWQQEHGVNVDTDDSSDTQEEVLQEGDDEMWIHLETVAAPLKDMIVDQDVFDNPSELVFENMIHDDVQEFLQKTLTKRELQVIEQRYGLDNGGNVVSLEDIGESLGISAARVAQIEHEALRKLRSSYTNRQVETYLDEESEVEEKLGEQGDASEEYE